MNTHIFVHPKTVKHIQRRLDAPESPVYFSDPHLYEGWLCFQSVRNMLAVPFRGNRLWRDEYDVYYRINPMETDAGAVLFTSDNGKWYSDPVLY